MANLRRKIDEFLISLTECTCGSGAHPRACAKHPTRYAGHIHDLNIENTTDLILEKLEKLEEKLDTFIRLQNMYYRQGE